MGVKTQEKMKAWYSIVNFFLRLKSLREKYNKVNKDYDGDDVLYTSKKWDNWGSINHGESVSIEENWANNTLSLLKERTKGRDHEGNYMWRDYSGAEIFMKNVEGFKEYTAITDWSCVKYGCLAGFWLYGKNIEVDIEVWGEEDFRASVHWGSENPSERTTFSTPIPWPGSQTMKTSIQVDGRWSKIYINDQLIFKFPEVPKGAVDLIASVYAIKKDAKSPSSMRVLNAKYKISP